MGETRETVGNATKKEKAQALSQISTMPSMRPTLKMLITKDMMQDIRSAIKNEKT